MSTRDRMLKIIEFCISLILNTAKYSMFKSINHDRSQKTVFCDNVQLKEEHKTLDSKHCSIIYINFRIKYIQLAPSEPPVKSIVIVDLFDQSIVFVFCFVKNTKIFEF